jgi:hypothetical protein
MQRETDDNNNGRRKQRTTTSQHWQRPQTSTKVLPTPAGDPTTMNIDLGFEIISNIYLKNKISARRWADRTVG